MISGEAGDGGTAKTNDNAKDKAAGSRMAYTFDSTALERAAAAAKTLVCDISKKPQISISFKNKPML